MARTFDPSVDEAIETAVLGLLSERGFGGMSIEAVASKAGVGKPAIYRRYPSKAALVAHVIAKRQLPPLEVPDMQDTKRELRTAAERGFPTDAPAYVRLIGGLIAEELRHPELISAFRKRVLGPRRAAVVALVRRGQSRGDIRGNVDPIAAVDSLAGPLLARVFAGIDTGDGWRRKNFETWWESVRSKESR